MDTIILALSMISFLGLILGSLTLPDRSTVEAVPHLAPTPA
jgi:hypothetical protein